MKTCTPHDLELWASVRGAYQRFARELAEAQEDSDGAFGEPASPWLRLLIGKAAHEAREGWVRESAALSRAEARAKKAATPINPAPAELGAGLVAFVSTTGVESSTGADRQGERCVVYLREEPSGADRDEPAVLVRFDDGEWGILIRPSEALAAWSAMATFALKSRTLDDLEALLEELNAP